MGIREVKRKIKSKEDCPISIRKLLWVESENETEQKEEEAEFSIQELLSNESADLDRMVLKHDSSSVIKMFQEGVSISEDQTMDLIRAFQESPRISCYIFLSVHTSVCR